MVLDHIPENRQDKTEEMMNGPTYLMCYHELFHPSGREYCAV